MFNFASFSLTKSICNDIRYLEETHHVSLASDILPQINSIVKRCLLGLKEVRKLNKWFHAFCYVQELLKVYSMVPHLNKMTQAHFDGNFHWRRDSSPETSDIVQNAECWIKTIIFYTILNNF